MRWFLVGSAAAVVASAASALVAKAAGIPFADFWPILFVSSAIYVIAGFLAARDAGRVRIGTAAAVGVSLIDATVGVTVAGVINGDGFPLAGMGSSLGLGYLLIMALWGAWGAVLGSVAGWVATRRPRGLGPAGEVPR